MENIYEELLEEVIFEEISHQPNQSKKRGYCRWSTESEKLLLNNYETNFGKFGPKCRFKNKEKFLMFLQEEMNKFEKPVQGEKNKFERPYNFSLAQVRTKINALENKYKEVRDNGTAGGTIRFPYYDIMHRVLGEKSSTNPEYLIGSSGGNQNDSAEVGDANKLEAEPELPSFVALGSSTPTTVHFSSTTGHESVEDSSVASVSTASSSTTSTASSVSNSPREITVESLKQRRDDAERIRRRTAPTSMVEQFTKYRDDRKEYLKEKSTREELKLKMYQSNSDRQSAFFAKLSQKWTNE